MWNSCGNVEMKFDEYAKFDDFGEYAKFDDFGEYAKFDDFGEYAKFSQPLQQLLLVVWYRQVLQFTQTHTPRDQSMQDLSLVFSTFRELMFG